ncbi:hypothetical protein E1573_06410 [Pseudomonas sp. H9]|nr:hypothetical protein E1573_06410 [Pseudomonas sp. H9]
MGVEPGVVGQAPGHQRVELIGQHIDAVQVFWG